MDVIFDSKPVWELKKNAPVHFINFEPKPKYHFQAFHYACGIGDYFANYGELGGEDKWQIAYHFHTTNPYRVTCKNCLRTAKKKRYPEDM